MLDEWKLFDHFCFGKSLSSAYVECFFKRKVFNDVKLSILEKVTQEEMKISLINMLIARHQSLHKERNAGYKVHVFFILRNTFFRAG